MDPSRIQYYTSDSKKPITSYLNLEDFDQSASEFKPISEIIKMNYGVTYDEPADKRRKAAGIKHVGMNIQEAPQNQSRIVTKEALGEKQNTERARYSMD